MTKQQIIDYVLDTPENTNPAILGQLLDEFGGEEEGEGEGEVWATYIHNENYSELIIGLGEETECEEGTTTTRTITEWKNFMTQADGKYKAKVKGYFLDFPNMETDVVYRGSSRGWMCGYSDKYNENYEYECSGEIDEEEVEVSSYYYDTINNTYVYPTKIEFIVYKK